MKKTRKRLLSLLLAVVMVVSALPAMAVAADAGETYVKVTDASQLAAGDQVIIVASSYDYALGTNQKTNNREAVAITKSGDTIIPGENVQILTLEVGTKEGTFAFNTGSGYLYAASSSGNQLKTQDANNDNGSWTIVVASDGVATITAQGTNTRNLMRYNPNNGTPLFACYSSGQQDISLYKRTGDTPTPSVAAPTARPAAGAVEAGTKVVLSAEAGAAIYYTTDGTEPTTSSAPYGADGDEITIDEALTIKAIAVKDDMSSPVATFAYTIQAAETETAEKMTAQPKDGDTVLIYNPAKTAAMGSAASGTKLAGVVATDGNGKLTISDEMAQLLVTVNEDGQYIFTLDGKYLTSGESGNSLSFADTLTDCGKWTLGQQTDGTWYIMNVGANYNGNYQALEYYNGFTTYGVQENNNNAYKMEFYLVSSAVVDPITDDMIGDGVLTVKQANESVATGVTVIGQVVYHYGKNYNGSASIDSIILEDVIDGEVYGFQVYDYTNYANYKVGDVVKVTGNIESYGGVMQMKFPTMEVVAAGKTPIPAQEITVSQMGADYLSEYVHISNVTLGTYSATGNTTVTDSTGTKNIYNGVPLPAGAAETDVIGVYGCCSAYNGTYQLRNGASTDYETNLAPTPSGDLPNADDQVVIYNLSAKGVLASQDDNEESPSITGVGATIADGKATPGNGGVIFTVEKNGDYYRFRNESYGYLCSNGTGNNAFYAKGATEDADWTLAKQGAGYTMESRTAKFNKYSQYMEYYSGAYKSYSMYNVTDYDIYTFQFYPVAEGVRVIGGLVVAPEIIVSDTLPAAYVGADYEFDITVNTIFAIKAPWLEYSVKDKNGNYLTNKTADEVDIEVPSDFVSGETNVHITVFDTAVEKAAAVGDSMTVRLSFQDVNGIVCVKEITITVKDEPVISDLTPTAGSQTGENKRPVISAAIANAGENADVTMTVNNEPVEVTYAGSKVTYTPSADLADGRTTVTVTVTRADGVAASKTWSFTVGTATYQLYFGQLHSHTQYSDGSGSLESALDYIKNLPESANVDFAAFTDHSNYFDKSGGANPEGALYDMSLASTDSQNIWNSYKSAVAKFNEENTDIVAIAGFEMTWSGGPGHINTFNTPGIVSRNNSTLNNKTADAGMQAYYALLSQPEGINSLSQFNHPGTTFGNFSDFAYWNPVIDSRMYMVEVGNGEGQIGQGGYYPSYEQYTMALDKGWHLAPTNNQDNHKGRWGNANDARDVILTDNFSEQGIYDAIRQLHMYATEDKNLEVGYTVNGEQMGAQLPKEVEKLDVEVTVYDPDKTDSISKVELIVNSGRVAYTWDDPAVLATGILTAELAPEYSYYYVRVTEGDGDIAVTAPVWVGETLKLGITSVTCGTSTPVTKEALTLTTTLFNSETTDATVTSITYKLGDEVLGTDTTQHALPASGTLSVDWTYTPTLAKVMTITVEAVIEQDGKEYTFTKAITLDVLNADELVYIGIDASHYNEYVAGNYKDSMGNFGLLAAGYSVRTVELETSEDLINACSNPKYKMIILTAPSRRDGTELRDPYATYSDAEIAALVEFNEAGGALVFTGWSDYYEHYSTFPDADHMAAQQNKILSALGSSLRISDDATNDDSLNGGQSQRLYFNTYGDSFLTEGVEVDPDHPNDRLYTEVFSHYGGASIYVVDAAGTATTTVPETVSPLVYGHTSTYSKDSDSDGLGGSGVPKYTVAEGDERLMVAASEQIGNKGLIVVSGAAFMSNFEVQATIEDNGSEKNYSNYKICENLVQYINPVKVTPIEDVRKVMEDGYKFTIEGVVTSNASGYDKDTAFFDCIYIQDATGGINCFPVAGGYKIGDVVRISGTTGQYQSERQIQVSSITKVGETTPVEPTEITAKQLTDGDVTGSLVTIKGTVEKIVMAEGLPQSIYVKDADGNIARVFIDGYITTDKTIANLVVGCNITATGLASYDDTWSDADYDEATRFPRIRVRDRAEIVCTAATTPVNPPVTPVNPVTPSKPSKPTAPAKDELPFVDVRSRDWFYEDVEFVYNEGIMNGTGKNRFSPDTELTRGMVVTILYRIENEPAAGKADMFGDVPSGQWYTKAVAWAADNGIVNGYPNGNFGPNDPITREQLAAILYRYTKFKGELVETKRDYLRGFADVDDISDYAVSAMNWAVGEGLIKGSNNKLLPKASATRAQVAAIIHRYLKR